MIRRIQRGRSGRFLLKWYLVKWPEGRPGLIFGILPRCDCVDRVTIVGKFASFRVFGEVVMVKLMAWSTTLDEIKCEFARLVISQDNQQNYVNKQIFLNFW